MGDERRALAGDRFGARRRVWYWKQNVDGHRDMGASIVCNYTMVTGLNYRGHMLQCFIMPEQSTITSAGRSSTGGTRCTTT